MKDKEFIEAIRGYIKHWDNQILLSQKEKLNGLAFSILVILDGMSNSFDGDRNSLSNDLMLHDMFCELIND